MIVAWRALFRHMNSFRNSVAVKITDAHCVRAPSPFFCIGLMVFTMKNPYIQAGEKQGEKRSGTHDYNGNEQKKAKKAPSAASLVP